jgi:hypothetical protein
LVGSPLDGTSLAAPPRLRAALDLLTNVGRAVEMASTVASGGFPFFTVVTGLLRVITSITTLAAKTPVIDAAVAMIPGLSGQSQVQNNEELLRLNQASSLSPDYFAVISDFQPSSPGWAFWKYFVNVGDRLKAAGADLVFEGPNDLVVDTGSMNVLARRPGNVLIPPARIHDFGVSPTVHHTVYFRQPETPVFIEKCLGLA